MHSHTFVCVCLTFCHSYPPECTSPNTQNWPSAPAVSKTNGCSSESFITVSFGCCSCSFHISPRHHKGRGSLYICRLLCLTCTCSISIFQHIKSHANTQWNVLTTTPSIHAVNRAPKHTSECLFTPAVATSCSCTSAVHGAEPNKSIKAKIWLLLRLWTGEAPCVLDSISGFQRRPMGQWSAVWGTALSAARQRHASTPRALAQSTSLVKQTSVPQKPMHMHTHGGRHVHPHTVCISLQRWDP